MWSHHYFKPRRSELTSQRRELMSKQDPEGEMKYFKLCMLATLENEDFLQKYLAVMLSKFMLVEEDFNLQL